MLGCHQTSWEAYYYISVLGSTLSFLHVFIQETLLASWFKLNSKAFIWDVRSHPTRTLFPSLASLCVNTFHEASSWTLLCSLSPRPTIHSSTLTLYPLPDGFAFHPSWPLIKTKLSDSSSLQLSRFALKPLQFPPLSKPYMCVLEFSYHLHSIAFVFTFFFLYESIIILNKTPSAWRSRAVA